MENKARKGFTLIELLLVMAVIGILSAIVTVYLNQARGKGADAKVKSQVVQLRSAIEIYYINNINYGLPVAGTEAAGTSVGYGCASNMFGSTGIGSYLLKDIYPGVAFLNSKCTSNGTDYAISIKLNNPGEYWCIDSLGSSKLTTAIHTTNKCP